MTALRRQGLWFSILALATGLLSVVFVPLDPQLELLLAGLCIVLLGVPHGALDPIFAQALPQIKNRTAWAVFVLAYLLLAALVVALWWYAPTTFLFGFLAVSVLHLDTLFLWWGSDRVACRVARGRTGQAFFSPDGPKFRWPGGGCIANHGLAMACCTGRANCAQCAP
jgi:hypothetical protein